MQRLRVLVADDQTLIREALVQVLASEFEVIGTFDNGPAVIEGAKRLLPDLVLLDVRLPLVNGLEAARRIKADVPATKIAILTQHGEKEYVEAAFQNGVSAYLLKSSVASDLISALHEIVEDRVYISSLIRQKFPDILAKVNRAGAR